jgi:hypothetical protein
MFKRNILAPSRIIGLYTMSDIIIFSFVHDLLVLLLYIRTDFLMALIINTQKGLDWEQPDAY